MCAEPRSADHAGLHSAADQRQCPMLLPGRAVDSIAFIHIPKTAGEAWHTRQEAQRHSH